MARNLVAKIQLTAEDDASRSIKRVGSSLDTLGGSVSGMAVKFAAALGGIVALKSALEAIGTATLNQDQAISKFSAALGQVSVASAAAVSGAEKFAAGIQRQTGLSQASVLELESLAIAYTKSAEGAQKLVAASVDVAAAVGISQQEAVRKLGASLTGSVEELARFDESLRTMSDEALRAGGAIDALGQRFAGAAAANVAGLAGSFDKAKTSLAELAAEVGTAVAGGSGGWLSSLLTLFASTADAATKAAEANRELAASAERGPTDTPAWLERLQILLGIKDAAGIVAAAEADLTERRRLATQATLDQAAAEALLAKQRDAAQLAEQVALLHEFGLELDGSSSKVAGLANQLIRLDTLFDATKPKAFAAANAAVVTELVAQEGGLERLETLYRNGAISANTYAQALTIAANTHAVLNTNIGLTSSGLESQTAIVDVQTGSLLRLAEAAAVAGQSMVALGTASGASFDQLARSQGRSAAVDEALNQGGRLVLGGTRIIVPRSLGGGSRIVREPGLSSGMRS